MIHFYGIASCDSCRKARRWLDEHGHDYVWYDVRRDPVSRDTLDAWRHALGAAALINKRSKTWRDFDAEARTAAEADSVAMLQRHPTLLKRPILETPQTTLAGFDPARYAAALGGDS